MSGFAVFPCLFAIALIVSSCDRQPDTTIDIAKYRPRIELCETVLPACDHYPTLCADPARQSIVRHYLASWQDNRKTSLTSASGKEFLALYAKCYGNFVVDAGVPAGRDMGLRMLWDLAGIAHTTAIQPGVITAAVDLDPECVPGCTTPLPSDAVKTGIDKPVTIPVTELPNSVMLLLGSVRTGSAENAATFADFVTGTARAVHFTLTLTEWSPACPLDVCGSSEPLTRTLILLPASYIDKVRKPDWSLAAVAVHEAAHIDWFYRPETNADPRLLLPVPNERQAWLMTIRFLRPLLRSQTESVRGEIQQYTRNIQEMLARAHRKVGMANRILGRPKDDETECLVIPDEMTWERLSRSL